MPLHHLLCCNYISLRTRTAGPNADHIHFFHPCAELDTVMHVQWGHPYETMPLVDEFYTEDRLACQAIPDNIPVDCHKKVNWESSELLFDAHVQIWFIGLWDNAILEHALLLMV